MDFGGLGKEVDGVIGGVGEGEQRRARAELVVGVQRAARGRAGEGGRCRGKHGVLRRRCQRERWVSSPIAGGGGVCCCCCRCKVLILIFGVAFVSDSEDALYTELWLACAGPLVTIPRFGERVFYFPQGHIEQVRHGNSHKIQFSLELPPKFRIHGVSLTILRTSLCLFAFSLPPNYCWLF